MTTLKLNFYVFTGGPGVGKTTLIRYLETLAEQVVEEPHRAVIREQVEAGGRAVPWLDNRLYVEHSAERAIADFDARTSETARVFFDRGIMDSYAANGAEPSPRIIEAVRNRRYNRAVFVFPPWREIYEIDAERRQTWSQAEATFEVILSMLPDLGYGPVVVPRGSVEARAAFVLARADLQVSTNARSSTKSPGLASEPST